MHPVRAGGGEQGRHIATHVCNQRTYASNIGIGAGWNLCLRSTHQARHAAQVHRPPLKVSDVDEQHDGDGVEALAQVALQAFQNLGSSTRRHPRSSGEQENTNVNKETTSNQATLGRTAGLHKHTHTCDMLLANTRMKMSP